MWTPGRTWSESKTGSWELVAVQTTSASRSVANARGLMSPRLPIGVATIHNVAPGSPTLL